jgi:aminopeptidase N
MKKYIILSVCLLSLTYAFTFSEPNAFNPEGKFAMRHINNTDYTRAESIHSYDVRHYQLNLNVPMTSGAYSGLERIRLVARVANFDTFNLNMVNLVCDSVKRAGINLTFLTNSGKLKITLDRPFNIGETCKVEIFYHRNSGLSNLGVYYFLPYGTEVLAYIMYTATEPIDSRYWFPCYDENWDKAEEGCEINVTVPDSFTVCSNGLLDSVRTSGGWKTFYWCERYPIATYLMTFTSSIYCTWSHWIHPTPGESIEIKYYVWRADSARSVSAFQNVIDMLQFFSASDMYGQYPFEKYGMNAVYPFIAGGMENQTMTMIHRSWLNGDDDGIAHELSHMWYGDKVTCFSWANIWLNEGFATYSDALYMKHQSGQATFINMMNSRAQSYFTSDNSWRHPVYNPPITPDSLFNWGNTYCKGSWVQHMLRYIEGDTTNTSGIFFQTMRIYGDSFQYGNATTEDYCRIHEHMTGLNLDWFFNEWIYQAGYPKYYYSWCSEPSPTPNQYQVITQISQNNGNLAPAVFHMPLQIKFIASGLDTTVTIPITTSPEIDTFLFLYSPTSMTIDPNSWVLKKTFLSIEELTVENCRRSFWQIYPNPGRGQIKISYNLPSGQNALISVYNHNGQVVRRFATNMDGYQIWDGKDELGKQVSSGVYFIKLTIPNKSYSEKIIFFR